MQKLQFMKVESKDQIRSLCRLAEEIWKEHFTPIIGADQVKYMLQKFQSPQAISNQIENGYEYFQIMPEGEMIGYMGIHIESDKQSLFLSKLYLRKNSRGKGYARQAIEFLAHLAIENHCKKIWLTVNRHNESTIKAYEKMGFKKVREQCADIGNGFVMDDYIMEKEI